MDDEIAAVGVRYRIYGNQPARQTWVVQLVQHPDGTRSFQPSFVNELPRTAGGSALKDLPAFADPWHLLNRREGCHVREMWVETCPSHEQTCAWYEQWFGRDYLEVYAHRDRAEAVRQIDLMERALNPSVGARVLDLCCGAGRHAVELARRGYRVTGVDLSADLLAEARAQAERAGVSAQFVRDDMRNVVAPAAFDIVVNFFTSFGYFDEDEENLRVLLAIRSNLRAGGGWLIDYLNRDSVIRNLVPRDERQVGDIHLVQERRIDRVRNRIVKTLTLARGESVRVYTESVRMYSLPELAKLCQAAGLRIEQTFGAPDGSPFTTSSPRLILAGTTL